MRKPVEARPTASIPLSSRGFCGAVLHFPRRISNEATCASSCTWTSLHLTYRGRPSAGETVEQACAAQLTLPLCSAGERNWPVEESSAGRRGADEVHLPGKSGYRPRRSSSWPLPISARVDATSGGKGFARSDARVPKDSPWVRAGWWSMRSCAARREIRPRFRGASPGIGDASLLRIGGGAL